MDKTLTLRVQAALQDKLSGPLSQIRRQAGASGQEMAALRERLRGLNAAQRDVGDFRNLSAGLRNSRTELAAAQARVAQLAQAMRSTQAPTRQMQRDFDRARTAAGQLKTEVSEKSAKLQTLRTRLSAAGLAASSLSEGERKLRASINQTNASLSQQATRLKAVAAQQQRAAHAKESYERGRGLAGGMAGMGIGGVAAGGGALYASAKMLAPGLDFDASMSKVQALARLDKDNEKMVALRAQARELGASTMYTAGQAADAQGFLAMAGFNPDAILAAMPSMLSLAKAGDTDLAQTADIASNILTGFDLKATEMGRVGDVLVGAFTRSNVSMAMLGDTMKYVAPVAAGVGQDIETVAAMAGKLGDAGIQGSMGGTALRSILGRLAAPPKAAAAALEELGIQAADAQGNLRDLPTVLAELYEKTKDMGNADRSGMFKAIAGEEAFSSLQVLVNQAGQGELQKFVAVLKQTAGEADKTAGVMANNLRGDLDELSSAWEDLGIEIEEQQDGSLRGVAQAITNVIGGVRSWVTAHPALASGIAKTAAVLAVLVAGMGALTLTLASILGPFVVVRYGLAMMGIKGGGLIGVLFNLARSALPAVGRALLILGRAFLMNPIGLAVLAIGLAAYTIYRYWEPIKGFFSSLWSAVKEAFSQAMTALASALTALNPMPLLAQAWGSVTAWFTTLWADIKAVFTSAMDALPLIINALNPIPLLIQTWGSVTTWFTDLWSQVRVAFDGGIASVGALLMNWSPAGLLYQAITAALASLGVELPGKFSEFGAMLMQGLINGITSMGGAVKDAITGMGGGMVDWFKEKLGIRSPSRVMMGMGEFVSEGAAQGITNGQPAALRAAQALAASVAIGGALSPISPAMANPGAMVTPASLISATADATAFDTRAPLAPSASGRTVVVQGDTITIHIPASPGMSADQLARAVEDVLRRRDSEKSARARSMYRDE